MWRGEGSDSFVGLSNHILQDWSPKRNNKKKSVLHQCDSLAPWLFIAGDQHQPNKWSPHQVFEQQQQQPPQSTPVWHRVTFNGVTIITAAVCLLESSTFSCIDLFYIKQQSEDGRRRQRRTKQACRWLTEGMPSSEEPEWFHSSEDQLLFEKKKGDGWRRGILSSADGDWESVLIVKDVK